MAAEHIFLPRLVYKKLHPVGRERVKVRATGLAAFMPGVSGDLGYVDVEKYRLEFVGLIVQGIRSGRLYLVRPGDILILKGIDEIYCRWHSGPLDRPDDPLKRIYCLAKTYSGAGYCREHSGSERALYDRCMGGAGELSIHACKELDKRLQGDYTVYLLDYGDVKPKVGSSRTFRWVERIAEQPHIAATRIYRSKSAYDARRVESHVASLGLASERPRKKLRKVKLTEAISRLADVAGRLSDILGYEWERRVVVIEEGGEMPKVIDLPSLEGKEARLIGYRYGMLLFELENELVGIRSGRIYHETLWYWR